jgi:predicted small metal-binding protein
MAISSLGNTIKGGLAMYELDCADVIPGCKRVIRAESQAEVIRRAVSQAKQLGVQTITAGMMDSFRSHLHEADVVRH